MAIPTRTARPGTFFITTATYNRSRLFQVEANALLLIDTLQHYRKAGNYKLHAFVVMPDHIHLLLTPKRSPSNAPSVSSNKKGGGGFSHRLASTHPVWQRGFSDHRIRDADDFTIRRTYIHENPVRAHLCETAEAYPFSSAKIEPPRHASNTQRAITTPLEPSMNTFRTNSYSTTPTTIDVPREETASLLSKVLGITSLGFLITALGVATAPAWSTLPGLIAVFILIFAISGARRANPLLALGLFLALTFFMGWEISPIIHHYVRTVGPDVVFRAAATTGLGMAAMGCVASLFNINYRRIAGIGFAALILLVLAGIASMFFSFLSPDTYSWLTLGIFTLLTIGDFARMRAGGDGQSAVSLSLSIYLDAINIFLAVLQLFGGRRRN